MKILMLGHTGVGKTTYMASMYGTLQTQINGFSLRATNSNHHRELLRMSNDIRRSIYPDGTLHRKQYDFSLQYQGRNVFPFEWVDYRGGALVERQRDSEEARRLVSELREVEGIMLFCACDVMAKASAARQVGRMMSLVGEALRDRETRVSVAIIFTKVDLVDEIDDELVQPVQSLLEVISKSETTVGTLIPVACGTELVNTEIPVLFALHFGIVAQAMMLAAEIELWQQAQQHWEREGSTFTGWLKDIGRSLIDEPTSSQRAYAAQQRAEEKMSVIARLLEPAEELGEYLKELPIV